ncbi:MAG: hypothetical protein KKB37_10145 [Alphaproteobacteria bacterium]|nr:hypothetical protein [Alphaproteobacteria bacterium]
MQEIDLATQTMFAELLHRCLDAEFDETFSELGTFRRKKSKGVIVLKSARKTPRIKLQHARL